MEVSLIELMEYYLGLPTGLLYISIILFIKDEKKLSIFGCTGKIGDTTFKLLKKIKIIIFIS